MHHRHTRPRKTRKPPIVNPTQECLNKGKDLMNKKELGKPKPRLFTKNIASCPYKNIGGPACPVTKSLTAAVF